MAAMPNMFDGFVQGLTTRIAQAAAQGIPGAVDPFQQEVQQTMAANGYTIYPQVIRSGLPPGVLGKGSFGMVYRARKDKNQAEYGVKMIERAVTSWPMIKREISILVELKHPSIVNLYETFAHRPEDWMFIAMEFVEGGDLLARLTKQPQIFDESFTRAILFHTCCALGYAHDKEVLHRDIKPENILLMNTGFPKVADFGLARDLDGTEFAHTQCGTPAYVAPEVKSKVPYRYPSDVFCLGLVLRDMMAQTSVGEWMFQMLSPQDKSKFTKQWPLGILGKPKPQFSGNLVSIMQEMTNPMAARRPTMFRLSVDLKQNADNDPQSHPLFNVDTKMPKGPARMRQLQKCCPVL